MLANYQKEVLKTQFIKTYSDLNNFSRKFYADEGISFSEYTSQHSYQQNYDMMGKYINLSYNKMVNQGNTSTSNFIPAYKTMGGTKVGSVCDDLGLYVGPGGRFYGTNNPPNPDENGPVVCVDTNGYNGPNKYGYDFFIFIFTLDGRTIPMGMADENNTTATNYGYNFFVEGPDYCKREATAIHRNFTCSYYALMDKHPLNDNKSYWKDFL